MKLTGRSGAPLEGEAAIPGDKSCSHRALIFGAMAKGETQITGLVESDDVLATVRDKLAAYLEFVGVRGPGPGLARMTPCTRSK